MPTRIATIALIVVGAVSTSANAGEVNGSASNPKFQYSNGMSICKFSGLNDYPDGSQSGPAGRTQSFGQDVANYDADPREFNPSDACNGNTNPYRDRGNPNDDEN